jgi:gallate decarboxylase subunit C
MQQPAHKSKRQKAETPRALARARNHDLASTLEWLRIEGDLIETDKPVDPDLEVTGLQKHMDGGCPVLFNNVKGKPHHRVITNLFGDMNVINKMFGWKDDVERTRKIAQAFRKPLKPEIVPR